MHSAAGHRQKGLKLPVSSCLSASRCFSGTPLRPCSRAGVSGASTRKVRPAQDLAARSLPALRPGSPTHGPARIVAARCYHHNSQHAPTSPRQASSSPRALTDFKSLAYSAACPSLAPVTSGGLSLDDLAAQGAALLPIPEPAALLQPSNKWQLSSQIRRAIEDAIRAGTRIALVQFSHLQQQQQQAHQQHEQQGYQQLLDQAEYLPEVDPAVVSASVPVQYASGGQRYLLLLEQPQPQPSPLEQRLRSHASASTSAITTTGSSSSSSSRPVNRGQPAGSHQRRHQQQQQQQQARWEVVWQPSQQHPLYPGAVPQRTLHPGLSNGVGSAAAAPSQPLQQQQQQQAAAAEAASLLPRGSITAPAAAAATAPAATAPATAGRAAPRLATAPAITSRLSGCKTEAELQQVVEGHWEVLDHIHLSAALVTLARIHTAARRGQGAPAAATAAGSGAAVGVSSHTDSSRSGAAAGRTSSSSQGGSSIGSSSFSNTLLLLAEQQLPKMGSRQISNTLWAVATMGLSPPPGWLPRFVAAAQGLLAAGTPSQGFANLIWALATLRWEPQRPWLSSFYSASQPLLSSFKPQELSSTLWALGSLGQKPPKPWLAAAMEAGVATAPAASPQALSNQVWGLAVMGALPSPAWVAAMQYAAGQRAAGFTPKGMSNLLWGFAVLAGPKSRFARRYTGSRAAAPGLQAAAAAAAAGADGGRAVGGGYQQHQQQHRAWHSRQQQQQRRQGGYLTQRLPAAAAAATESPAAAAATGSASGHTWLEGLVAVVQKNLHRYPGQALSNSLWALATFQQPLHISFLQQSSQAAALQVPYMTGGAVSSMLWAYGGLGFVLPRGMVAQGLARVVRLADSCSPRNLADAAAAVALQHQQQQQQAAEAPGAAAGDQQQGGEGGAAGLALQEGELLQQLLSSCQGRLSLFRPKELCDLGRAAAAVGVAPDQQWQEAYLSAVAGQLPALRMVHVPVLLQLLAAWGAVPAAGWTASFMAATCRLLPGCSAAEAVAVLQGISLVGLQPEEGQLQLLLDQLLQPGGLDAPSMCGVWEALVALGFRPPEPWLEGMWAASQGLLRSCSAEQLVALLPAVLQLQAVAPAAWMKAYHAAWCAFLPAPATAIASPGSSSSSSSQLQPCVLSPAQAVELLAAAAAPGARHRAPPKPQLVQLLLLAGQGLAQLPFEGLARGFWAVMELDAFQVAAAGSSSSSSCSGLNSRGRGSSSSSSSSSLALSGAVAAAAEAQLLSSLGSSWQQLLTGPAGVQGLSTAGLSLLVLLAKAVAKLQQPMPPEWSKGFATAILGELQLVEASDLELLLLLKALPWVGGAVAQPALATALVERLQQQLGSYSPSQLTELVRALQAAGVGPSRSWMVGLTQDVLQPRLVGFRGWQLVSVLSCLARMRYAPDQAFLREAAKAAGAKLPYISSPGVLLDLFWALAALSYRPSRAWVGRYSRRCLEVGLGGLAAGQLAKLAWCLAAVQRPPGREFMAALLEEAGGRLHELQPQGLSDLLCACALLDEKPGRQWLDAFLATSRHQLPNFQPHVLASTIWSLALLQQKPPAAWLSDFHSQLTLQLPQLSGPQLAKVVWAMAALDCRVSPALLQGLVEVAEVRVEGLAADALAQMVWGLDRLDGSPHKVWVKRVAAAARAAMVGAVRPPLLSGSLLASVKPQGLEQQQDC